MSAGSVTGSNKLVSRYQVDGSDVLPVTRAMLADHVQVDHSYDDTILYELGGYLPAATEDIENRGNVALIQQNRRQTIGSEVLDDGLKHRTIALTVGPVISVSDIQYIDSAGAQQVLSTDLYRLTESNSVFFLEDAPSLAYGPDAVWINYVAGYGTSADSVPSKWRQLVMVIASRMYDFRGLDSGSSNDSWERMIQRQVDIAGGSHRG
jgi:uncharacterized phiE125 gp8 family phage protein